MRYFEIVLLLTPFLFVSCGKSPLLNKIEKNADIVGGITRYEDNPSDVKHTIILTWTTPPSLTELGAFEIELNSPLSELQILHAYLWMPDMGHGSSPIEITEVTKLKYTFKELAFIMRGLWVLHIEILNDNKVVEEWQQSITL